MKASFDGIRMTLASDFNKLVRSGVDPKQRDIVELIRNDIVGLLCMYDEETDACHCLIDDVFLESVNSNDQT